MAHENTLHWNPKARDEQGRYVGGRVEGRYRGFELRRDCAYQFGWQGDNENEYRNVNTVRWTGLMLANREPEFVHVDTGERRSAELCDWFGALNENLELVDAEGNVI